MPAPVLNEIENVADEIAASVAESRPSWRALWQLDGPATTGKSVCLTRIAEKLAGDGALKPIVVAPPAHHLDAGPAALADVAMGLGSHGLLNGELQSWSESVGRWSERIASVQEWVSDNCDDVVLLCDAPRSWGANRADDDFFRDRGFAAAFGLTSLHCRRVVAGGLPIPVEPQRRVELSTPSLDLSWLRQEQAWGTLAPAATALADSTFLEQHPPTPLQVRLLVAAIFLSSISTVAKWWKGHDRWETRSLVQRVAELMQQDGHRPLWDTWLRLSITRRPFDHEVFEKLMRANAPEQERDIARHCLLFGEETLRMHDELKLCAVRWRREHHSARRLKDLVAKTNLTLFNVHRARFERFQTAHSSFALGESMEAYHFASVIGQEDLLKQVKPAFVDQLDALGWSLSYERRKYADAARAFEQALIWDEMDDYAHQYLAYNLDRIGRRLEDVELHFRRAVELNSMHPWWRSRLITFLVGRGRLAEAREAWEDALLELGLGESDASVGTYEHLHCWVAGSLINAGEIVFAREVLDAVPPWARAQIDIWDGLSRRADAMLQLGRGDAVVPSWRLLPQWWEEGPALLQHRLGVGKELVRWLAGRVVDKDENGIHLRAALVERDDGEPPITRTVIPDADFEQVCRDDVSARDLRIGSFVEVGLYVNPQNKRERPDTLVRVLPSRRWDAPVEPAARADRYLKDLVSNR